MTETFAARLERLRGEAKLTMRALAVAAGLTPSTLHDIATGRKTPTISTVAAITAALGLTMAVWQGVEYETPAERRKRKKSAKAENPA